MPFDDFSSQAVVPFVKAVRHGLALLAASVVMSGAAPAQDQAPMSNTVVATNSTAGLIWRTNTEPTWAWSPRMQVSGLFVDLIMPQRSWVMLNPPQTRAFDWSEPLPITALLPMNDTLDIGKPDFALLRFRF